MKGVTLEGLQRARSEPKGRSAVEPPSRLRPFKGFFQDLPQNQLAWSFLSSCWGITGQEVTMC